jgi:hypothetical protein
MWWAGIDPCNLFIPAKIPHGTPASKLARKGRYSRFTAGLDLGDTNFNLRRRHISWQLINITDTNPNRKGLQKLWRTRVSIPVPHGCKPCALPFELDPRPGRREAFKITNHSVKQHAWVLYKCLSTYNAWGMALLNAIDSMCTWEIKSGQDLCLDSAVG